MEYKKNQILEVEITDMGENGEGIGKVLGYTLFVKDAVIGDKVKARLTKIKKNYSYARLEEIVEPSEFRVEAPCPISRQCGGCQIQALKYEKQLEFKETKVKNDLVRLGGFEKDFIESIAEPIIGMNEPYRYRNKAQYPVGMKNKIIAGFYAGRTHSIIETDDCIIGCEENKEILNAVISYMEKEGVTAYDETTGEGVVRHILIRKGFTTGEIMVCLVVNVNNVGTVSGSNKHNKDNTDKKNVDVSLGRVDELISSLRQMPGMTSISLNINNSNTNVIMGDTCITLWGMDSITDYIGDVKFKISPLSFFQVNPVQTKKFYEKALEYADLKGSEIVWDLYCGIGTVSLFLARSAKKVYGVEIVEQAILDARENAKINGIDNVEFIVGAAEDIIISQESGENNDNSIILHEVPDVVVVDPPRKGCDEKLLNTIMEANPSKIVYISCNPATLARDLKILTGNNNDTGKDSASNYNNCYNITRFCPIDQFCHSVHVETVVVLEKKLK